MLTRVVLTPVDPSAVRPLSDSLCCLFLEVYPRSTLAGVSDTSSMLSEHLRAGRNPFAALHDLYKSTIDNSQAAVIRIAILPSRCQRQKTRYLLTGSSPKSCH